MLQTAIKLVCCAGGLYVSDSIILTLIFEFFMFIKLRLKLSKSNFKGSYLTWGLLQERIITREYGAVDGVGGEKFSDSQFLVFINRLSALIVAGTYLQMKRQPRHG